MKIPVFDIDWTLLGKYEPLIHHMAFLHAFKKHYGLDLSDNSKEGSIDNQIIFETLINQGIKEEEILNNLDNIRKTMTVYFKENKHKTTYEPMSGVVDLLEALQKKKIPRGLLTGNVEEIGWAKLEIAGIKKYFQFGAFGSMAMTRPDLVSVAAKKATETLGYKISNKDIVVIGDTPLDVACGKGGGAFTIAVATCPKYSYEDLRKTDADLVVKNMTEKDKILEFLEN